MGDTCNSVNNVCIYCKLSPTRYRAMGPLTNEAPLCVLCVLECALQDTSLRANMGQEGRVNLRERLLQVQKNGNPSSER